MHQLLNTLYVQTPRSFLHLDHETLKVKVEGEVRLQIPLLHLGAIYCFGDVGVSTALLHLQLAQVVGVVRRVAAGVTAGRGLKRPASTGCLPVAMWRPA